MQTAYSHCFSTQTEGKINPFRPKDNIANLGEYYIRQQQSKYIGTTSPSHLLNAKNFGELADEICSTFTIQLEKIRAQLESIVSSLDLPEKLEGLGARDSHNGNFAVPKGRYTRTTDTSPIKSVTPVILGYSEPRVPRFHHNPTPPTNTSFVRAHGHSPGGKVDPQNKSFDLPTLMNTSDNRGIKNTEYDERDENPTYFVKVHATPMKSVEVITQCPQTGAIVLGGLGKTDLHQNRIIATMDIRGMAEILKTASCHAYQINGILARDSYVFTYSKDTFVKVFKTESLDNLLTIKHEGSVLSVDYDQTNKRLFTCGKFGTVKVWNIEKNKELPAIRLSDSILTMMVKYVQLKDWLAIGDGLTGKVFLYDLNERIIIGQLTGQGTSGFVSLNYFAPITQLVGVYADGCVKIWDISGVQKKKPLEAMITTKHASKNIFCCAVANFETQVLYLANTGMRVQKTNLQSGKVLSPVDLAGEEGIKSIAAVETLGDNKGIVVGCKSTGNIAVVVSS